DNQPNADGRPLLPCPTTSSHVGTPTSSAIQVPPCGGGQDGRAQLPTISPAPRHPLDLSHPPITVTGGRHEALGSPTRQRNRATRRYRATRFRPAIERWQR